ncbi:MAG: anti-sigma regulatory factor [Bacteroidetes bacterium]|nr:anti-sigma regulatory factor [Bacteroidota bacterium]
MVLQYHIEGGDFVNAGKASSAVKGVLKQLDVSAKRIRRVVIALYETEVNVVAHANRGDIEAVIDSDTIEVTVKDSGPGIPDIEQAMKEGFSTASKVVREMGFGAGMGLPNIKRNSDLFHIESVPGKGTTVKFVNELKD